MICEKHLYKEDLYRFYGKKKLNIKEKINMSQEMKYIVLFRKVQETRNPIKQLNRTWFIYYTVYNTPKFFCVFHW